MGNYKLNESKKSKGVIISTLVFAILGAICLIIGYKNEIVWWLKNIGIVLLVIVTPLIIYIIYKEIISKIKEM